ncbi:hypothetical protein M569_02092, partial [Genlisea aurea]
SLRLQLPVTHTPARKPSQSRRVSLPLSLESPNVSVNAPRIDKMVEFQLTSSDGTATTLLQNPRASSTSAQCSFTPPSSSTGDRSITKDKCTVQTLDRPISRPASTHRLHYNNNVSESSEVNLTCGGGGGGSSRSSSDSRQRRFDTSSYQQRAEALEGLLEFSAQLLQQERFDELQVLLKPFGPEKVSPRETAIWLSKSFKENVI